MKRFEIAVILGIILSICTAFLLNNQQEELANSVLRLHVIANSNSQFDQLVKLKVRDRILEESEKLSQAKNVDELKEIMRENTDEITALAQDELLRYGCEEPVTVLLGESYFPTKEYGDISFPAGRYQALKVVIGEGKGENWWCVCFPPICTGSAMGEGSEICIENGLGEETVKLITSKEKKNTPYIIKFKLMEWLGQAKEYGANRS